MKVKTLVKTSLLVLTAATILFGANTTKAEAKGTAFMNQKVSNNITPTVKSFKRTGVNQAKVTVTVPTSKVKKLKGSTRITVAYGSTKNGKKFEAIKKTVTAKKTGKNTYTFTLKGAKLKEKEGKRYNITKRTYNLEKQTAKGKDTYTVKMTGNNLQSFKDTYITVCFKGLSNWSGLKKLNNNTSKFSYKKVVKTETFSNAHYICKCGIDFNELNGSDANEELYDKHRDDADEAACARADEAAENGASQDEIRSIQAEGMLHYGYNMATSTAIKTRISYRWVEK